MLVTRDCQYVKRQTNVLGETDLIQFGGLIDGQPNPVEIDLGLDAFQVGGLANLSPVTGDHLGGLTLCQ